MAFASITYTSASGTTFALTNSDGNAIEYLRQSDISVTVNGTLQTLTTDYTFNAAGTSIVLNSAVSNATVVLSRTTSITDATVSFTAGSTLTAQDLNNSDRQNRFALQEFSDIYDSLRSGTGDLGDLGGFIDAGETWVSDAAHAATTDAIDARVDSKIDTALTGDVAAGNAITITDDSPSSGQITIAVTDGAIDTAELADGAVTTAKITDSNVTTAKINDAAVTTAKLADANVTTAKIADDAITSAKIADGTIIAGDIAGSAVTTAKIADSNVTTAKIADSAITNAKLATDAVTQAKLADDSVGSAEIIDSAITTAKISTAAVTTAKIADSNVTTAKIADGAVTNVKLADAELQELATMGGTTAAALADLTAAEVQILDGATVTTAELNTLDGITANVTELNQLDGNTLTNSPTWTSASQYPTAAAIDSRITARIDPIGGFEAIADEDSFPATAPPEGTVVSIANANGLAVNASGVGAGTRAGGTDPVVINGFPAGFNSTSLDDGIGLLVISTSTAHTYDFHRVVAKDEDVRQLSSDINDFKARYRVGDTEPTTDNDAGDLFFDTAADAMKVRNAANTAWGVVQSTGDFILLGLRDENASTGPTFNGSNTVFDLKRRDDLSVAASVDQAGQLLVSVNGVIQNANAGTTITASDEGFVLSESDEITFATAPPTGAEVFVVQLGTATDIGTPSDGTVTNVKVSASAAIAGTKIDPDFGSQTVETTGVFSAAGGAQATPSITFTGDLNTGIYSPGADQVAISTGGTARLYIAADGDVGVGTTTVNAKLEISGNSGGRGVRLSDGEVLDISAGGSANDPARFATSSGSGIAFAVNGTSGEDLRIDSSGRLLVGTSTSMDGAESSRLQIVSASAGRIGLGRDDSEVTAGNTLGAIHFYGNDGGTYQQCAVIRAEADGDHANDDKPTRLIFSAAADGASTPTERMRISANGNITVDTDTFFVDAVNNRVGVGLTSPANKLHIRDASDATIRIDNTGGTSRQGRITVTNEGALEFRARQNTVNGEFVFIGHGGTTDDEHVRIDSSGRLLVGTSTNFVRGNLQVVDGGGGEIFVGRNDDTVGSGNDLGHLFFGANDGGTGYTVGNVSMYADDTHNATSHPSRLVFLTVPSGSTSAVERMRINNQGLISCFGNIDGGFRFSTARSTSSNGDVFVIRAGATAINTGTNTFQIQADGDVQNQNNSYGAISDAKLKENIVDASSQWNDLKAIQIRNYNFKEETGYKTHTQIGVVAQEVELVSPGLVTESPDRDDEGNDLGTTTKSVNYSVLYMKAVKALQEAMERIETLETKVANLEGGSN